MQVSCQHALLYCQQSVRFSITYNMIPTSSPPCLVVPSERHPRQGLYHVISVVYWDLPHLVRQAPLSFGQDHPTPFPFLPGCEMQDDQIFGAGRSCRFGPATWKVGEFLFGSLSQLTTKLISIDPEMGCVASYVSRA